MLNGASPLSFHKEQMPVIKKKFVLQLVSTPKLFHHFFCNHQAVIVANA
jgi:hypothetical protein